MRLIVVLSYACFFLAFPCYSWRRCGGCGNSEFHGGKVNLVVEITNVLQPDLAEARSLFCERCQNLDEIVVAILKYRRST
jgi:hypothetical protein